jgi:hypothetical protein
MSDFNIKKAVKKSQIFNKKVRISLNIPAKFGIITIATEVAEDGGQVARAFVSADTNHKSFFGKTGKVVMISTYNPWSISNTGRYGFKRPDTFRPFMHFYLRFAFSLLTPALTGLRETVRCESRPPVEMLRYISLHVVDREPLLTSKSVILYHKRQSFEHFGS